MKEPVCPHWPDIEAYLDARSEDPIPEAAARDVEFEPMLAHIAKCSSCGATFVEAVTTLHRDERIVAEAGWWAVATGLRAAAIVGERSESSAPAILSAAEATEVGRRKGLVPGLVEAAESLLQEIGGRVRLLHLSVSMPGELVFVGSRAAGKAVAAQQFAFQLDDLSHGGWDPVGTAWISPREILVQLNPAAGATSPRSPRFAFRSSTEGLLWLEDPVGSEVLADGSHLFRAWRLDPSRPIEAQVHLPLDGFAWFGQD